jgi:hypothetical protein
VGKNPSQVRFKKISDLKKKKMQLSVWQNRSLTFKILHFKKNTTLPVI